MRNPYTLCEEIAYIFNVKADVTYTALKGQFFIFAAIAFDSGKVIYVEHLSKIVCRKETVIITIASKLHCV
jgi:hypothetical protein